MPRRIQNINGVPYVYEDHALWDTATKNAKHTRHYIGKMVNNVFVPNKKYLLERELNAKKQKKPGPVPAMISTRQFYGATYLFDQIGIKLKIDDDLRYCLPDL